MPSVLFHALTISAVLAEEGDAETVCKLTGILNVLDASVSNLSPRVIRRLLHTFNTNLVTESLVSCLPKPSMYLNCILKEHETQHRTVQRFTPTYFQSVAEKTHSTSSQTTFTASA